MFSAGSLVAVDVDYQQQIGYVGSGIAAAYVSSAAAVNQDPNYVRRVTFNVGRVAEVTTTSLVLSQPLLGGAPAPGASAQVVVAFVDREGGSFFQEWSALFVAEEESGGRVCFYYPRLSAGSGRVSAGEWCGNILLRLKSHCRRFRCGLLFWLCPIPTRMMGRACCATGVIFRRRWRRLTEGQQRNLHHRGHRGHRGRDEVEILSRRLL